MLIGIVGKANVGKSTFFKAATLAEVAIAPHPFTTIKPNEGVGFVRVSCVEQAFSVKCTPAQGYCISGTRFVPVKLLDVAGLVPGAHLGKGLGLQFLDDLRQADCLIQIVDASGSTNEVGELVQPGSYDPLFDVKFLEFELDMWFLGILHRAWERIARQTELEEREVCEALAKQLSGLNVSQGRVKGAISKLQLPAARPGSWTEEQLLGLAKELRQATKPMLIAANKADLPEAKANIERLTQNYPGKVIACSAEAELALRNAARQGLIDYIPGSSNFEIKGKLSQQQELGLQAIRDLLSSWGSTGVQQVLDRAVFELLGCIAVWPVPNAKLTDRHGRILPDCLLLPGGSSALDLAYAVHSDIGNAFVKAIDVKTKKILGKSSLLKHGDVIEIVTR